MKFLCLISFLLFAISVLVLAIKTEYDFRKRLSNVRKMNHLNATFFDKKRKWYVKS